MNAMTEQDTVDLDAVRQEVDLLLSKMQALEDATIPTRVRGKSRTQEIAEITRQLLYMQHLARRIDNAIMDQFWRVRGQEDHLT